MKDRIMNVARFSLLICTLLFAQHLFAQKTITGVVIDGSVNETLIGANVAIKGSTIGTVTDIDGRYTISASANDVLIFSYIGLEKKEIVVGNNTIINVTLTPVENLLQEVVAIGYGVVKKSDLTGSIAVVSAKELTKNPSASAAQALQGKAPGVLVTSSGYPGGGSTIRVRGVGSINSGSDPIYIVDGVRVGGISGIQPNDIESMQVLKDASATAIYGANGSNGVIIITTKRGKSGKTQVSLNGYMGINLKPKKYDVMNADEYSAFYNDVYTNYKKVSVPMSYQPYFREKYYGENWQQGTDWQDQIFNTGLNQNYNLSVAGGGDNNNFNVSLAYTNEIGNVMKSNFERYSIRANSDFKINKYIKFGENLSVSYSNGENPYTIQSSIWDLNQSPLMKVYNPIYKGGFEAPQTIYWENAEGQMIAGAAPAGYNGVIYNNTAANDKVNILAAPSLGSRRYYGLNALASIYMQIDFTDWLMYKVTPSAEVGSGRSKNWMPKFEGIGNRPLGGARLEESYYESIALSLEQQLSFRKTFFDVHNVQATAVYEVRDFKSNNINGTKNGYDFESLNTLFNGGTISQNVSGFFTPERTLSYLGRVMYDYKGKYLLTGSYRSDGSSVFAPGKFRRGNFYSGSVAWKVNEDFFTDVKEIDALKIRLGWGQTGNSKMSGSFLYYDNISNASEFSPVFGDDQKIANAQYVFKGYGSKEIRWETAEMLNVGIDLMMYNAKLQLSAEYYLKTNNDLLLAIPISSAHGRQDGEPYYNIGGLENKGLEVSLQWRDKIGDINYGISSNLTTINNKVTYMNSPITSANNRTIIGQPVGTLYGLVSEGVIQLNESNYAKDTNGQWQKNASGQYIGYKHSTHFNKTPQPGDLKFADLNGDGDVNNTDRTMIGNTIPKLTYTLGFDISYKNFDMNVFLFGVAGYDIYNRQRATLSSMNNNDMDHNKLNDFAKKHWTLENASTTHVRIDPGNSNSNDQLSSFWIEDGSFLRIKDVQFGYNLPTKLVSKVGLGSVRTYLNASNLYVFTAYKGRDPEGLSSSNPLSSGVDNGNYAMPRNFTLGLQIGF